MAQHLNSWTANSAQLERRYAELAAQYQDQITRSPEDEDRYRQAFEYYANQIRRDEESSREYIVKNIDWLDPEEKKQMTTAFSIDLNNNSMTFGTMANGQITDLKGNIGFRTSRGSAPLDGLIEGTFIGDIKAQNVIPITIPHKKAVSAGFNIMVIGAGGTGGYLIRDLAKFVFALREKGDSRSFAITIIDGDEVEKKNVLRQNFISRDIGKKKADILAKRYANAFGIEIQSITQMADKQLLEELNVETRDSRGGLIQNIVIGCVDNHAARREIMNYVTRWNNVYWIDSGNETKSGQVVIGHGNFRNSNSGYGSYRVPSRNTAYNIPCVIDLYPEIADSKQDVVEDKKSSCAERAMIDTQNIFVNMYAAGHVLSFTRQIIMQEPITINAIEYNIKGVTNVTHLTEGYLRDTFGKVKAQPNR